MALSTALLDLLTVSSMTLATCSPDGEPHAAPVYFAAAHLEPLQLYFFSDEDSQHARDLAQDPRAAAALYPETSGWRDIRGLQLRGLVTPVPQGPEWQTAWELYQAKFPFVSGLRAVVTRNQLYVFVPRWLRRLDNRLGLGYKEERVWE